MSVLNQCRPKCVCCLIFITFKVTYKILDKKKNKQWFTDALRINISHLVDL